jgi:hypothetical protein
MIAGLKFLYLIFTFNFSAIFCTTSYRHPLLSSLFEKGSFRIANHGRDPSNFRKLVCGVLKLGPAVLGYQVLC